ncbi:MAG TPA: hypothetical protein VM554_08475 [Acidisarcina sp.]|nr:hypothetical protein [Acidisarcina sp.]
MFDPAASSENALLITEELLVFATVVGSVAAMPVLIEFIAERRKRRERIDLSLEDEPVSSLHPRLAGMDTLLENIADLIDRARNPARYGDLKIGNEVLIIGPNQSGKKSLAQKIALLAGMERIITVYNPRDSDALAKAKSLVRHYKRSKVLLLLPRIDLAYQESNPELLTELDALIETTSERQNVLVVATTVSFQSDSDLDNIFGIKIALPGAEVKHGSRGEIQEDAARMLAEVARFYLKTATSRGYRLEGMTAEQFCDRILESVINPAEIEDIVVLCETAALFRKRARNAVGLVITPEILETAIGRVVVA